MSAISILGLMYLLRMVSNMNSKISKGLILLALMESLEDFKEHVTSPQLDRLDKELDNVEELLVGWLDTDKTPEE